MNNISFAKLSDENFTPNSMDEFLRWERITEVWKKIDGEYKLTSTNYVLSWDLDKRRGIAKLILRTIHSGGFAFGAFEGSRLVGYILSPGQLFGSAGQYLEISLFHVSTHHRRMGIGTQLFQLACAEAKQRGAQKLYISGGPAANTQAAYRKLGCILAQEIDPEKAARNSDDVQLEYML